MHYDPATKRKKKWKNKQEREGCVKQKTQSWILLTTLYENCE